MLRTTIGLALLAGCLGDPAVLVTPEPPTMVGTVTLDVPTAPTAGDADDDGFVAENDCDDGDPTVFPGAPEICDGKVTDCDRGTEDGLVTVDGVGAFEDLQQALDWAAHGSEVAVCGGTWRGRFVSTAAADLVAHGNVTLDGEGLGTTLTVPGGSTVDGFVITSGRSTGAGGGLAQSTAGSLGVADCRITANSAVDGAGIALPSGSEAVITGTVIELGSAERFGGGIYAAPGSTVELVDSELLENVALEGGGAWLGGLGTFDGVGIDGNTAEEGGGVRVAGSSPYGGAVALDLRAGRIVGNGGAGVSLSFAGLASDGTDWGTGGDDNDPADVSTQDLPYSGYAAAETFGCDPTGCTPAP